MDVCQVRRLRLAPSFYFFHAAIIPRLLYEDNFLLCCPSFFAMWAIENFCCKNAFFRGSQLIFGRWNWDVGLCISISPDTIWITSFSWNWFISSAGTIYVLCSEAEWASRSTAGKYSPVLHKNDEAAVYTYCRFLLFQSEKRRRRNKSSLEMHDWVQRYGRRWIIWRSALPRASNTQCCELKNWRTELCAKIRQRITSCFAMTNSRRKSLAAVCFA